MKDFVNVGTNSYIAVKEIDESAPIKRMVNLAKDENRCVEVNYGKRVKAVIVLKSGKIFLSALLPQTIVERIAAKN